MRIPIHPGAIEFRFLAAVISGLVLLLTAPCDLNAQQRNSTKKIRIEPTAFSGKCGSAVNWRKSVAEALEESATTGKPVFWYVPTVENTFMDRVPEVNRYMLAGVFSWPEIIGLMNEHFVPVKAVAEGELATRYELVPYKFVEPGFLIVDKKGDVLARVDQKTTQHPRFIAACIRQVAGIAPADAAANPLEPAWEKFRNGESEFDFTSLSTDDSHDAEKILLEGMFAFRRGEHDRAREIWNRAKTAHPDHPLAWKAVAEAENWGPFVRGLEVHDALPPTLVPTFDAARGSAAAAGLYTVDELWKRSTRFLLGMQRQDGAWVDSDYDFGGTDSLPNVHVAVTSICGMALLDAMERNAADPGRLRDAILRAADFVSQPASINYVDRDEILWAQAYRIRFLARVTGLGESEREKYRPHLETAVKELASIQTKTGSWYHEYSNPFVTATALLALHSAKRAGVEGDSSVVEAGLKALASDRFDDGAWPYYGDGSGKQQPEKGDRNVKAAAGRMPTCEMALWLWGKSADDRLQDALQAGFDHHNLLAVGYKYDNHTSTLAYGGFFFWFDMLGRAEALSLVADPELREKFAAAQFDLVMKLPEIDGCFVDSHELGRCYGTAMALQTMAILERLQAGKK